MNETYDGQDRELLVALYRLTHDLDGTRPVIDTSGYIHVVTDIYDTHDYVQDVDEYVERYSRDELPINFPGLENTKVSRLWSASTAACGGAALR